jgi:tRNA 2-selenouridine synthase
MSVQYTEAFHATDSAMCLDVKAMLAKRQSGIPVVDVRSPSEYLRGHIPGAQNVPLLSDDERAIVGTVYFRNGKDEAIKKGFEIINPKLSSLSEKGLILAKNNEIIVYCWRGGMRSASLAWLYRTSGLIAYTLQGGYKAYRRYIHEYLAYDFQFIVIGGMTGSGKTEILREIKEMGYPAINLEELAFHKGSVFGGIGEPPQPTTEHFENILFEEIIKYPLRQPVLIEDESIAIGSVFIPKAFHLSISKGILVNLIVPFEERVNRLASLYGQCSKGLLIKALKKIERRLGHKETSDAIHKINEDKIHDAVTIVLKYYDKVYSRTMHLQHSNGKIINYKPEGDTTYEKAINMINYLRIRKIL